MVYVLLAEGFEDIEALAPVDILRRASVDVKLAGVTGETVTSANGVTVQTDCLLCDVPLDGCDMLVLPGGSPGWKNLRGSEPVLELVRRAHDGGKLLAAICGAPVILAELGLLKGRRAVCYPGMESELTRFGAVAPENETVVRDGNIITARAAGSSIDFGLRLAAALNGEDAAGEVCRAICYTPRNGITGPLAP
ncbi:MAG: DJ-1/PfpI family protein [Oscillospiraceae bacterium]|nr:DJ-1/PfpI family protein [Oscillospiraceae bacterium]